MEVLVVSLAALAASTLTLFSGFGLGTLLMPVVAVFFPLELAVAMTAIVHLANNVFKVGLIGRYADTAVLWRFGLPAIAAAILGAVLLDALAGHPPLHEYEAFGRTLQVTPIKLVVGLLIFAFVLLELSPRFASLELDRKYLPIGGLLSGFFGGLSGHQGALRSMFLIKLGLGKESFVATGAMLAMMVDLSRLGLYGWSLSGEAAAIDWTLVIAASLSAFVGAFLGAKLLHKVTIRFVQAVVSVLLVLLSLAFMSGVL